MAKKKNGRPKVAKDEKRDKAILLKFNEKEYKQLMLIAEGCINLSGFIRNRLFYNSTFQQVQPEEFINTMNNLNAELIENKESISDTLSLIRSLLNDDDATLEKEFNDLIELYKHQLDIERKIANYMRSMLKAGRKTKF